jgi:hypothetical protein
MARPIYWLTTDGPSWAGPAVPRTVHTVAGDQTGPFRWTPALCGAGAAYGWYDDYDHRDGGQECAECRDAARRLREES